LIRLVSMLAIKANDEWLVTHSYISKGSMDALCARRTDTTISPKTDTQGAASWWRPEQPTPSPPR
jgi:hypothetical protein